MNRIEKEIDAAIEKHARALPGGKWAAMLRNRLNNDIYSGPTYLTKEGEPCSMFDSDYHHAFNFKKAARIVRDWCDDNLGTMYYDSDCGHLSDKAPEESEECEECHGDGCEYCAGEGYLQYDLSRTYEIDATKTFLGNELARTI